MATITTVTEVTLILTEEEAMAVLRACETIAANVPELRNVGVRHSDMINNHAAALANGLGPQLDPHNPRYM